MKKLLLIALLPLAACGGKNARPAVLPASPKPQVQIVKVPVPVPAPEVVTPPAPPPITIPALPDALHRAPEKLPDLIDGSIKGVMRDGAKTDSMYNDLSARYRALVKTFDCVRNAVNGQDSANVSACLTK